MKQLREIGHDSPYSGVDKDAYESEGDDDSDEEPQFKGTPTKRSSDIDDDEENGSYYDMQEYQRRLQQTPTKRRSECMCLTCFRFTTLCMIKRIITV